MSFFASAVLTAYFVILIVLSIYGFHRYLMVYLYYKHRDKKPQPGHVQLPLPTVTVQLPVFNEMYVVERLIDAVAALSYPREHLEIQLLDDSTDETSRIIERKVRALKASGFEIHHLKRQERRGYKAGALEAGLSRARGELIAVFDADFVPSPSFLTRVLPYFSDEKVGMVQARWDHVNGDYSLLTRVQSILLDAHFLLEHGARNRSGRFFNFNGTAGVWRRSAIEQAGGWEHDTLTEDMDLSYRAQLQGWRFVFLQDVVAPAEIPVAMNAFKSQQRRWSKGSIQCARKLLPRILASPLSLAVKVEAVFHLTANLTYPLMAALSLLMVPAMLLRFNMGWSEMLLIDLPLFLAATASVSSFYIVSQKELHANWWMRLTFLPLLLSLGIGICLSNARAVLEGLSGKMSAFVRTPKYRIETADDQWQGKRYREKAGWLPFLELGLGIYFTLAVVYAVSLGIVSTIPFLVLFQVGFLFTGLLSVSRSHAQAGSRGTGSVLALSDRTEGFLLPAKPSPAPFASPRRHEIN